MALQLKQTRENFCSNWASLDWGKREWQGPTPIHSSAQAKPFCHRNSVTPPSVSHNRCSR